MAAVQTAQLAIQALQFVPLLKNPEAQLQAVNGVDRTKFGPQVLQMVELKHSMHPAIEQSL